MIFREEAMQAYLDRSEHSRGEIKAANEGPRTWAHYCTRDNKSTKSTSLGSVIHTYCLDPQTFPEMYVMEPALPEGYKNPRSTKAYKESVAALQKIHPHAEIITADQLAKAKACFKALKAHPAANRLLFQDRMDAEVTVVFKYDGLDFKIRPDVLCNGKGGVVVVDLKTAADARPHKFMRSVADYGYDYAAWLYTQGVSEELGCSVSFVWVVVDTADTQHVRCYRASNDMLTSSRHKCLDGIQALKGFLKDGIEEVSQRHDHTDIENLNPPAWESEQSDLPGKINFGT